MRLKFIPKVEIHEKKKALKNNVKTYEVGIVNNYDPSIQLAETKNAIAEKLKSLKKGMKLSMTLQISLSKPEEEDYTVYKEPYFNSSPMTVLNVNEILEALEKMIEEILERIATWISEGSGWRIVSIMKHYINVVRYLPLRGKSYIELPEKLRNSKKGLINIKNEDNECFCWSHIRLLNPINRHPQRITIIKR